MGLSLWATAIDSSDLVADSGFTYETGIMYFVGNWLGGVTGWVVAANFIFLPMYRAGMYTNAEYLEARFGVAARVISVFVQVQYRTLILGIIANTMYLVFAIVCGWDDVSSWTCVVAIALLASVYTALGGLKSVAITDAMQTIIMVVGALVFFFSAVEQSRRLERTRNETRCAPARTRQRAAAHRNTHGERSRHRLGLLLVFHHRIHVRHR